MSYNLLFNTQLEHLDKWEFRNCTYENGHIISNNKVFSIEQELVLPDIAKLYFRVNYNIISSNIKQVYIGISNDNKLSVTKQIPRQYKDNLISVVEETKQEKVKVYIIFESTEEDNRIKIKEPLLCDLNRINRKYWLKSILDKTVKYVNGFSYTNELKFSEIKPEIFNLDKAKTGSIISTLEETKLKIPANLIKGKRYLIKLDYREINELGKVYIKYGNFHSTEIENNQLYLSFQATDKHDLMLVIKPNNVLPYQVNLEHLLLIESAKGGYTKQDIPYLSYI